MHYIDQMNFIINYQREIIEKIKIENVIKTVHVEKTTIYESRP